MIYTEDFFTANNSYPNDALLENHYVTLIALIS